jgi:UDP-N-acetylglucosamine/UDP-N-acetylgalactosamine diphosphorylase
MASTSASVPEQLRARYAAAGQAHVFQHLDAGRLAPAEAAALLQQLEAMDIALVNELFHATVSSGASAAAASSGPAALTPCSDITRVASAESGQLQQWRSQGLAAIAAGQAAALILAGGQGTRLGSDRPKGEYDVGLPSGRTLFHLQALRVQRLRVLAQQACAGAAGAAAALPSLPLYIMTSPMTDVDTRAFWAAQGFFGLPREDVVFFCQGTLPCLSPEGAVLLETGSKVAEAPDGNGGIYRALHLQGIVADMQRRGVLGVHVFAVDNALVRPADPLFLGFCMASGADVGSKVCPKAGPHEKIGVLCQAGGQYSVVEYSEMDAASKELRGADGQLVFGAGNLCIHFYSTAFLAGPCSPEQLPKVYHVAKKVGGCCCSVRCRLGA